MPSETLNSGLALNIHGQEITHATLKLLDIFISGSFTTHSTEFSNLLCNGSLSSQKQTLQAWVCHHLSLQELVCLTTFSLGYKMRTNIWKALKKRGKAICTAISKYNKLASQMNPPAPTLEWKDIVNYTFISEFDMLHHMYSHADILSCPWALQANRELTGRYFKVLGAKEEIVWLNVELRHLHTGMVDEQVLLKGVAASLSETNPALAAELRVVYDTCLRINQVHMARLKATIALPGYNGPMDCGVHHQDACTDKLHDTATRTNDASMEPLNGSEDAAHLGPEIQATTAFASEDAEEELMDNAKEDMVKLGDFFEDLAVSSEVVDDELPRSRQGIPLYMLNLFRV